MIDTLRIRTLTAIDKKNLYQRMLKLVEEVGELSEAILSSEAAPGTEYKNLTKMDVEQEIADVLILILSIAQTYNFDDNQLNQMITHKCNKWARILDKNYLG